MIVRISHSVRNGTIVGMAQPLPAQQSRLKTVLRLLAGENLVALAAELNIPIAEIEAWRRTFVTAGEVALDEEQPNRRVILRHVSLRDALKDETHPDQFVWWDGITHEDVAAFENTVELATREQDVQTYLTANPIMLVQPLGGGHGRWVIPHKRLGSEFVTDFVIGDKDSSGYTWVAVELEGPRARLFTKVGDESAALRHAWRQIEDWRVWLQSNQNYASRRTEDAGLGLIDISPNCDAWIIIGRRGDLGPAQQARRREWGQRNNVKVHTYDWLIERARGRVEELDRTLRRVTAEPVGIPTTAKSNE